MGYAAARKNGAASGKRSGLEVALQKVLDEAEIKSFYERKKFSYTQPEQKRWYLADFEIDKTSIILEAKGRLTSADRKKMILLQEQHPKTTFIMVFGKPYNKLSKASKTTYADWCDKQKILWLDIEVLKENPKFLSTTIKKLKRGS